MNVSRTWIATSLLLVIGPALARAQESTPKAQIAGAEEKASRDATAKAKVPALEGPFLVKPYLQLGHTQTPGKLVLVWHAADSDADWAVEYTPVPAPVGRPPRLLRRAGSRWPASTRTGSITRRCRAWNRGRNSPTE